MGLTKIYASGAEYNAPDGHSKWRDEVQNKVSWFDDMKLINPMMYFNYSNKAPDSNKQCHNYFMWLIDQCDVVLVNLDYSDSSIGTGQECQHALDTHKPIIGFGKNKDTWYGWTVDMCEVVFDNYDDAISYIVAYYNIEY